MPNPVVDRPIQDHGATQGAVDAGDRHSSHVVDEHLMPGENAFRVSPYVPIHLQAEDDVVVVQIASLIWGCHSRVPQWRDAILLYSSPTHLIESDRRFSGAVEIGFELRVDQAVERGLEISIVGV